MINIEIIDVLDTYIQKGITEGNTMLKEMIDVIYTDPNKKIHKLLIDFKNRRVLFESVAPPDDIDTALFYINSKNNIGVQYICALYILKFQNPVVSNFVDLVLERIDAI